MYAGDTIHYTLASCREMALTKGASQRAAEEELKAAEYTRKAALAAYFPKVSANGSYMWNSRKAHLLADQTQFDFGTAGIDANGTPYFQWSENSSLSQLAKDLEFIPFLQEPIKNLQNDAGQRIANTYQQLYDKLTIDLTHVVVAQVGITQPIYTGGRITQAYKIAHAAEHIAALRLAHKHDEIIVSVDEAYWRVVAVKQKKELADNYYQLLCKLDSDVVELVKEGLATQSDLLKVHAKKSDAEVKKLQADNGLVLSRMALAQVCGMPLGEIFTLDESGLAETPIAPTTINADELVEGRSELQIARETEKIAHSSRKLASAGLQPTIIASAGYIYTNPYAENGVSNDWHSHGFFSAGVVVNVPIAHADDILRYKAAKHAANAATLKADETRDLLILQTTQAQQKLMEAQQKIALAQLSCKNAEEVLRMAEESFEAGLIPSSDLMQAQTAWLSAASDLVDAQTEAKVNETRLQQYCGKL